MTSAASTRCLLRVLHKDGAYNRTNPKFSPGKGQDQSVPVLNFDELYAPNKKGGVQKGHPPVLPFEAFPPPKGLNSHKGLVHLQ